MIPHRTHRPDANRDEIVEAIEKLGWSALNTGMVGEGFPDLIATKCTMKINTIELRDINNNILSESECLSVWRTKFIEIKSPKGKYTPKEQAFMDRFPGLVVTLRSVEDVAKEFGE